MERDYKIKELEIGNKIRALNSAVLAEGDVIVPDIKPDVGEIMSVEASVGVKKCEPVGRAIRVSGTVFVNILYLPEDEEVGRLCSINTKFDFSDEVKCDEQEGAVAIAEGYVRHIDFSLINSRKLSLKVYVGLNTYLHKKSTFNFLSCDEQNSIIEINPKEIEIYSISDDITKDIIVSENIDLPSSKSDIGEILKVDVEFKSPECKLMNGRAMVKGIMNTNILYITADSDEEPEFVRAEIPFSEIIESDSIKEDSLCSVSFGLKDYYYSIKNDINDDPRCVFVETLLSARLTVADKLKTKIAEDCFIPGKKSKALFGEITYTKEECNISGRITVKERIGADEGVISEVLACTINPVISEEILENSCYTLKGTAAICAILKTSNDGIVFKSLEIPLEYRQDTNCNDSDAYAEATICLVTKNCSVSGGELELSAVFDVSGKIFTPKSVCPVTSCTPEEDSSSNLPMLVIYFVKSGDTLWSISKKYKTTPKKIADANAITDIDKIQPGMKLLIPAF